MKTPNEFTKEPAFINRKEELAYLHDHIAKRPENILFIYGPKSSGKTTLLYKFVEAIQADKTKKYNVKHFNLRKLLIVNYADFIKSFFIANTNQEEVKEKTVKNVSAFDFKFFALTHEEEKLLIAQKADPFLIMEAELKKLNAQNIRPLVIIDELQALEGIYLNGQRELLKEMFNFFVAMTKESHLCQVLIASSDGYFIERIYEDSKLKKTSDFFEVKYLTQADTLYWLNNLAKESAIKDYVLSESQINAIWDFFGGSCWEVSNFLGRLQKGAQDGSVPHDFFESQLNKIKIMQRSKFVNYVKDKKHKKLFSVMHEVLLSKGILTVDLLLEHLESEYATRELSVELMELVTKNVLAYDPTTAEYALQGRSMEVGLAMYAEMIA